MLTMVVEAVTELNADCTSDKLQLAAFMVFALVGSEESAVSTTMRANLPKVFI
jgi:hypothetical protein